MGEMTSLVWLSLMKKLASASLRVRGFHSAALLFITHLARIYTHRDGYRTWNKDGESGG